MVHLPLPLNFYLTLLLGIERIRCFLIGLSSLAPKMSFYYVIEMDTSYQVWNGLDKFLVLATKWCNYNFIWHFKSFRRKISQSSHTWYLQKAKMIADELAAVRCPLSPIKFNVPIFHNLGQEHHSSRATPQDKSKTSFLSWITLLLLGSWNSS